MEEEKINTYLISEDPELITKALTLLQGKLASNNGVLVVKDLVKLKNGVVKIFESKDKLSNTKVLYHLFDFLTSFMTNNYGNDYELQFTSYILDELIKYCIECEDATLESAEDALETYIRTYKQLENVVEIITNKFLNLDTPKLVIKGIKLATKNIEFHPKIISIESEVFIHFIERLCAHINSTDSEVTEEIKSVVVSYIKRFPSTMREISVSLESKGADVLLKLIAKSCETIHIKKHNK